MICVTGSEPTVEALTARIEGLPQADLHEARLDLVEHVSTALVGALPAAERLIVTCRRSEEGGQWQGDEPTRVALFAAALEAGARYVDVEADAPDETWRTLHDRFGADRLVASLHRFEPLGADPGVLAPLLGRLTRRPAATLKLAVSIEDVIELAGLRALRPGDDRPLVRIGMGLAGLPGRVRYDVLGSPWTYVSAPGTEATAPGQLDWHTMQGFIRRNARRLLVLFGAAQVVRSPGPRVYNALAALQELDWYYLAAPTRDLGRAVGVLDDFGLAGASVTMPHKASAADLAHRLEDNAARLSAANTLALDGVGGWRGYNTDGVGVLGALAPHLDDASQVAVLGTGGAARAAVAGLTRAGHDVYVVGRRPAAAADVARDLGGTPARWTDLPSLDFKALVNATPIGQDGLSSPVSAPMSWEGKAVLDMVLHPSETPLLRSVGQGGGVPVPGVEMWVHQGAAQWSLLTGRPVTPEALTHLLLARHEDPLS